MQTSPAVHKTPSWSTRTAARTRAANALPYPELANSDDPVRFWLTAWMRNLAEYEALRAFVRTETVTARRYKSDRLNMALHGALSVIEDNIDKDAKHLCREGGILFAFPETTMVQGGAA